MCSLVKFVDIVLIMSLVRLGSQIPRFFIFSMLPFFLVYCGCGNVTQGPLRHCIEGLTYTASISALMSCMPNTKSRREHNGDDMIMTLV